MRQLEQYPGQKRTHRVRAARSRAAMSVIAEKKTRADWRAFRGARRSELLELRFLVHHMLASDGIELLDLHLLGISFLFFIVV
jgi:hypothetical protein